MKRKLTRKAKYAVLMASMMLLTLLLCGCRTRISNNSEITATITDESGYLQENYDYRRDDLGLSTAKKPIINLAKPTEEEEYYDDDYEGFDDYDSEDDSWDSDDPFSTEDSTEDEKDDSSDSSESSSGTTTTTSGSRKTTTGVRRPSTSTTTTTTVKVTLNANGGKCSSSTLVVRKGSAYGSLPTPTRSGYTFQGWYTKKEGGSQVKSTTKVSNGKAHTLYAHWKEQEKEVYKVSFDGNGDGDPVELSAEYVEIEEGGKYPALADAKRAKYKFDGWYTKAADGDKVKAGDKFTANSEQTLYAHWKEDKYNWWNSEFTKALPATEEERLICYIPAGKSRSDKEAFVSSSGKLAAEGDIPACLILFDDEDTQQQIAAAQEKYGFTDEDLALMTKLLVSQEAIKKGDKNNELIYKMLLLSNLYGTVDQTAVEEAAEDLGASFYPIEVL